MEDDLYFFHIGRRPLFFKLKNNLSFLNDIFQIGRQPYISKSGRHIRFYKLEDNLPFFELEDNIKFSN
jgi:hypothetical protein